MYNNRLQYHKKTWEHFKEILSSSNVTQCWWLSVVTPRLIAKIPFAAPRVLAESGSVSPEIWAVLEDVQCWGNCRSITSLNGGRWVYGELQVRTVMEDIEWWGNCYPITGLNGGRWVLGKLQLLALMAAVECWGNCNYGLYGCRWVLEEMLSNYGH